MTKLETLIQIAGSRRKLAKIIGVSPGAVDIWARTYSKRYREDMPIKYNERMKEWARQSLNDEECAKVNAALTIGCPVCGRPW